MKQSIFTILENTALTRDVYRMVLEGDTSAITASGQFVNIQLSGKFLRRPISVCDWNENTLTIVDKVVGHGTEQMSSMAVGEKLDILTGLGNGYDLTLAGEHPVLIGGGVGVPPMYGLAKRLIAEGGDAIKRHLDYIMPAMRRRGGFIPTCDHGVPEEVTFENYMRYRELMRSYCE